MPTLFLVVGECPPLADECQFGFVGFASVFADLCRSLQFRIHPSVSYLPALFCCSLVAVSMAAAQWKQLLQESMVPDAVSQTLGKLGYNCAASFAFSDDGVFKSFAKHLLVEKKVVPDVQADSWEFQPLVGILKGLWLKCQAQLPQAAVFPPSAPPASAASAPLALALPGISPSASGASRLTVLDRDKLKREFEKKYPSTYITPASLPAMSLLQLVHNQAAQKTWDWLPWKKILSEKAATAVRGRKSDGERDAIAEYLMAASGVQSEQWDLELSPSPYKIQCLLQVRANAFAMCGACHLGSWSIYIAKFLEFYSAETGDHFRPPSVQEAEEADKAALQEAFALCFAGNSLDDALSTVAVDRDLLRHLLVAKPKLPKLPQPPRPPKEPRQGREPLKRKQAQALAGGKKPRSGKCFLWMDGLCDDPHCRYKHQCAKCGSASHDSRNCKGQKGKAS